MTTFPQAMAAWQNQKEAFVKANVTASTKPTKNELAPRSRVTYSIPTEYKETIDSYIQTLRQKADLDFLNSPEYKEILESKQSAHKRLSLDFEKSNPPPSASNF